MNRKSVMTDEQQLARFTEYQLTLETTSSLFDEYIMTLNFCKNIQRWRHDYLIYLLTIFFTITVNAEVV